MASNNVQWTREGLAWAAGLFEGEGCIAHTAARNQWQLVIQSTDHDVLLRFQDQVDLGAITGPQSRGEGKKPVWTWRVTARGDVYGLLAALYPWLGARRQERARECLTAIGSMPTLAARKCKQGHSWSPQTVVRKRYGGRVRRVCATCLAEGRIEIRTEVVA